MKRILISLLVAAFLTSSMVAMAATAEQKREVQKLVKDADKRLKGGDADGAADTLEKADEIYPAATTKLALAKALLALDDLVAAGEVLREAVDLNPTEWAEKKAKTEATKLLEDVNGRTPKLEIEVFEPEASKVKIKVDGEAFDTAQGAMSFNPGKVKVVAVADGYKRWTKKVKLKEGVTKSIEITMEAGSPSDETANEEEEEDSSGGGIGKIPAYVAWGVGAIGLGLGIGFGVAAIEATNDVRERYDCEDGNCPNEAEDDLNVALLNGDVSTAGFIIGGVGVIAGTILFFVLPDGDEEEEGDETQEGLLQVEAKPIVGPGFVGLVGTF